MPQGEAQALAAKAKAEGAAATASAAMASAKHASRVSHAKRVKTPVANVATGKSAQNGRNGPIARKHRSAKNALATPSRMRVRKAAALAQPSVQKRHGRNQRAAETIPLSLEKINAPSVRFVPHGVRRAPLRKPTRCSKKAEL